MCLSYIYFENIDLLWVLFQFSCLDPPSVLYGIIIITTVVINLIKSPGSVVDNTLASYRCDQSSIPRDGQ